MKSMYCSIFFSAMADVLFVKFSLWDLRAVQWCRRCLSKEVGLSQCQ